MKRLPDTCYQNLTTQILGNEWIIYAILTLVYFCRAGRKEVKDITVNQTELGHVGFRISQKSNNLTAVRGSVQLSFISNQISQPKTLHF